MFGLGASQGTWGQKSGQRTGRIGFISRPSLTRSGIHYGTPLYMTPEIARGLSDLDEKSDVFALGILL